MRTVEKKKARLIETPVLYAFLHYTAVIEVVAVSRRSDRSCKVLYFLVCFSPT